MYNKGFSRVHYVRLTDFWLVEKKLMEMENSIFKGISEVAILARIILKPIFGP